MNLTDSQRRSLSNELDSHSRWLHTWIVRAGELAALTGQRIRVDKLKAARDACTRALELLDSGDVPDRELVTATLLHRNGRLLSSRGWILDRLGIRVED